MNNWYDLTHVLNYDIIAPARFPKLSFVQVGEPGSIPEAHAITIVSHMGTHLDAQSHFIKGGKTITDISLERLTGEAVVWGVEPGSDGEITVEQLESMMPKVKVGDAVILSTGWYTKFYDAEYRTHPYLSVPAAQWLVDAGVQMVGMDTMSPDLPAKLRPEGYTMPVHNLLLGNDVLIIENVGDASAVIGHRVELIVGAIPYLELDGAQVRLLARIIDAE